MAVALAGTFSSVHAAVFTTFTGGLSAQTDWRNAVGNVFAFEGFEGFATNDPITSLPALSLSFDPLVALTQPGIYNHSVNNTPSGTKQIATFPGNCCITSTYQFLDLVAHVDSGVDLYAFAFWNGDPQGAADLRVYDLSNVLLGTVTAAVNTGSSSELSSSFAGFISSVPVSRLEFEGNTGDGFNHYDDFHVSYANPIPEPEIYAMMGIGLVLMGFVARRRKGQAAVA